MWCRKCRHLESHIQPVPPGQGREKQARDDPRTCAECGAVLTAEDRNDLLSQRLQKFGLLDEAGTLLERKERGGA